MKTPLACEESNAEIQYEKNADSKNKKLSWFQAHSIELSLVLTASISIFCEYYFAAGTIALVISLIVSLIFEFSAVRHDNIPMFSCYFPIIGNYLWVAKHFSRFYDQEADEFIEYSKKHNDNKPVPLMAISMPTRSLVVVTDPVCCDIIFRKQFGNAIKEKGQYDTIRPLLGNGIFTSNGAVWKVPDRMCSFFFQCFP